MVVSTTNKEPKFFVDYLQAGTILFRPYFLWHTLCSRKYLLHWRTEGCLCFGWMGRV